MFKQIKTFWSKKLKSGEQIYLVLMIIIIILSIYIAFIEINQINNINKELEVDRSNLEELKEIKDYSEHLDTLFSVYYSTGRSLDSQREEIKLDAMGATSIDLNFRMKDVIWQSCININSLYPFLNDTANCSQIISSEIVFDKSELQKLGSLKIDLINLIGDLKKSVSELESTKEQLINKRNFLYLLLVILSGIGIAYNYFLDKIYN